MQPELGLVQLSRARGVPCAALLLLALSGCVCNPDVCIAGNATPVTLFFATTGEPVTVTPLLAVTCGSRMATSVAVSVLDPASNPVSHTKTEPRTLPGAGFDVDLTFTPAVPGTYHVVARFEPNFGSAQVDVIVAAERRDAGSVLVTEPCERGDFTPGGLILCTRGGTVNVLDAGQSFTGIVARWQSTLWVSDGGTVHRLVEDGGAFELTGVAVGGPHEAIVPGAEDALLRSDGQLWLWLDGGIRSVNGPSLSLAEPLWRSGTDVAFLNAGNRSWCSSNVPGDAGERCTMLTSPTAVALGPEGLWLQNETALPSTEALLVDHRISTGFALPGGWGVFRPGPLAWDNGVVLDAGLADAGPFVLARSGDALLLENYGPNVRAITSTCVTAPEGSSTRLYRR